MHANEYEQQADPNCWLGDWPGQKLVSSKSLVPLTPLWTGYHAKTGRIKSGETWMKGLDEEGLDDGGLSGDSSATPLYTVAGEPYASGPLENQRPDQLAHHTHTHTHSHSAADDDAMYLYLANLDDSFPQYSPAHLAMPPLPPITTTAAPLATEGEMPMSINLSPVSLALDPMLGITHSHTHGHGHAHTASVSSAGDDKGGRASTPSSARNKSNKTAQGGGDTADTLSHSVSIKFSCTTGQLSNIMSLLASTGLPVNMKIDTE
ncbi:hypothetical protein B0T24DRAFT_616181 [Lasiosphaeria ovina]|uniref:Uncharacterized protein n=1 Tax=Lasiosphaeria ovina TaxID=92902 RepID=A0AAE0TV12_9PEZI|nr:hypothetical protein B0T24DRAFT_616181 [Lasiosphaeria ovina]